MVVRRGLTATAASVIGGAAAAVVVAGTAAVWKRVLTPKIFKKSTRWNDTILERCPHLAADYSIPGLLNNGHVETIFAAWFRKSPHVLYDREILHMPDGGVVTLDTEDLPPEKRLSRDAPVLILLPGLTGGSEDTYVQHAVVHAREAGIRAVVFNGRGTSGSPVTTPQFYSASYTEDMRNVVAHVQKQYPDCYLFAAGWSLGANILVKYLGEEGQDTPINAAVAMCNPFNLPLADKNFQKGFNKIYDFNLAKSLNKIYKQHNHLFEEAVANGTKSKHLLFKAEINTTTAVAPTLTIICTQLRKPADFDTDLAIKAKTIREFDDSITRIAFGWPDVDAYYQGSSSADVVDKVTVPLLVIQAEDDPIAPAAAIPYEALHDNENCILVVTPTGGHLGWCSGEQGVLGAPWTDKAVAQYFVAVQELLMDEGTRAGHTTPRSGPKVLEPSGVYTVEETTHQAP